MTTTVNIHEAKTQLSKLLQRVMNGEEIIIAKAGVPVARLTPYTEAPALRVLELRRYGEVGIVNPGQFLVALELSEMTLEAMTARFDRATLRRIHATIPLEPATERAGRVGAGVFSLRMAGRSRELPRASKTAPLLSPIRHSSFVIRPHSATISTSRLTLISSPTSSPPASSAAPHLRPHAARLRVVVAAMRALEAAAPATARPASRAA